MTAPTPEAEAVAVVSHPNVYPSAKGNAEYVDYIVRGLRACGLQVDYFTTVGNSPAPRLDARYYLRPFRAVRAPTRWIGGNRAYALSPQPWFRAVANRGFRARRGARAGRWTLPELDARTARWMAEQAVRGHARVVFANYFNTSAVFAYLPPDVVKAIIVHDVLALRLRTMQAMGLASDFDEGMIARETAGFRSADVCIAIKAEEADHIRSVAPHTRVVTIPFATALGRADLDPPREPIAVFVGSDNFPNRDALAWLLAEVWPGVHDRRREARLRVVGRVAATHPGPWPSGAEAVGPVDDLSDEYDRACVALTPLRVGSGLKIKTVEALAAGLPGVATSVGAEGVPNPPTEILRIADDAESYAQAIVTAIDRRACAADRHAARAYVHREFSHDTILPRLREIVDHGCVRT